MCAGWEMKMNIIRTFKIIGLVVFISFQIAGLRVSADDDSAIKDPIDYSKSKSVVISGSNQPIIYHPTLREVVVPEYETTFFYAGDSLISPTSEVVYILYGGTGARTANYGVVSSYLATAQKLVNLSTEPNFLTKIDVIGVENKIYNGDPDKYATSQSQVDATLRDLNLIVSMIPRDSVTGRLTKKIVLVGRSTSTAVEAQLLHDAYVGRPGTGVVSDINLVLLMGMLGHNPDEITAWDEHEKAFLYNRENAKNNIGDPRIQPLGKKIFEGMSWSSENVHPYIMVPNVRLPKVLVSLGSNDFESVIEQQIKVAERFSYLHPNLAVIGWGTDTEHNPAAESVYRRRDSDLSIEQSENIPLKEKRKDKKNFKVIETMKRKSPILEAITLSLTEKKSSVGLKPVTSYLLKLIGSSGPGFNLHAMNEVFDAPYIRDCKGLMARLGSNIFKNP